ncbi:MAG: hypothetical protein Q9210_003187 [Variospora velana]
MPPEVNAPTIYINGPTGILNAINPLYNYTFHPQPSDADFPPSVGSHWWLLMCDYELEWWNASIIVPQYSAVPKCCGPEPTGSCKHATASKWRSLITQQSQYGPFSNMGFSDERGGHYNSIENMHNGIHMLVGNGGHMGNIPYSSFDPIFWLHHANVDRLFALWQAIYPNATVTPQVNAIGTFTVDPGTTEDINTQLSPFHSDDSGQIVDWDVDSSQLTSNVKARLNSLYDPSGSTSQRARSTSASNNLQLSPSSMNAQWFANIRVQVSSMTSPFFVHLFLGDPPADAGTWSFAPNLVGSHSVVDTSRLSAANSDIPTTLFGQVPLNHAILVAGNSDLAPSNVVPLLTSQLKWRLQNTDDSPLDIGRVSSLKVHVVGQAVKARATDDEFPEYGPMQVYKEITVGKAGGLGVDDDPD